LTQEVVKVFVRRAEAHGLLQKEQDDRYARLGESEERLSFSVEYQQRLQ